MRGRDDPGSGIQRTPEADTDSFHIVTRSELGDDFLKLLPNPCGLQSRIDLSSYHLDQFVGCPHRGLELRASNFDA